MSVTNTPNMNLPVPGVGSEIGPDYATDMNNCMSVIDNHSHAIGYGVPITPDGIAISSDLTFLNNNAIALRSVRMQNQSGVLSGGSDLSCIYNNGGNLYFNDGNGVQIAITSGGGVAGSPGSIANLVSPASATYTAGSKLFTWAAGTSGKAAAMDNGAMTIRETNVASAKGVTLASPIALAADYQLTLPTGLPGSTQYVSCDTSGNLGTVTADAIAAAMTSTGANAILVTSSPNIITSSACTVFTTSSTSPVDITNLSVSLTTTGHPVELTLIGIQSTSVGSSNYIQISGTGTATGSILFLQGSTILSTNALGGTTNSFYPSSSFKFIYTPAAGTYTWKIQGFVDSVSSVLGVVQTVFMARELRY